MNIESSRINGNLLDEIERLKDKKDPLKEEIKEYVQNVNHPLEDRWEVFCAAGGAGIVPDSRWIFNSKGIIEEFLNEYYDSCTKYETINILDLFDDIEENVEKYGENFEVELKEAIIKEFIFSFKFDW